MLTSSSQQYQEKVEKDKATYNVNKAAYDHAKAHPEPIPPPVVCSPFKPSPFD